MKNLKGIVKKLKAITLVIISMTLLLTGCGKKEDASAQSNVNQSKNEESKIKVKVGMDGQYMPICYVENGESKGFEVEVWKEIGKRANMEVEFVVAQWTGLYGMLDSNKIDSIACQMAKTPEREEKYAFSDTYLFTPLQLAVKKDNNNINSVEDLKGKKVGVAAGGNEFNVLKPLSEKYGFEIVTYDGSGIEYDVAMGRTDACLQSAITVADHIKKGDLDIKLVGKPLSYEEDGYAFRKDEASSKVIESVNKAIQSMHEDGTLSKISQEVLNIDATKKVE